MISPSYAMSRVPDVDPDVGATPWPVGPSWAAGALTDAEAAVLCHVARGGRWNDVRYWPGAASVRARGLVAVLRRPVLTPEGRRALAVAT